ncbi:hypothetical protein ACFXPA_23280 [Amycolatopsis sp. NPDC059090]|uniref:hypothetical protein n=1 Tax=Amycolatopsis sp. NPDC059090 TaxID=3346723 RepID=UPI0036735025
MPRKPLNEIPDTHLGQALRARAADHDPSVPRLGIVWRRRFGSIVGRPDELVAEDGAALAARWAKALWLRPDGPRSTVFYGVIDGCEVVLHTTAAILRAGAPGAIARSLNDPGPVSRRACADAFSMRISSSDPSRLIPIVTPVRAAGKHAAEDPPPDEGCFHGMLPL